MDHKLDGRIATAITVLEQQRDRLISAGETFVAYVLDIALLELRRRRHGISEDEIDQLAALVETRPGSDVVVEFSRAAAAAGGAVRRMSKGR